MYGIGLALVAAAACAGYRLVVSGKLTIDLGLGRTVRALGPFSVDVAAPPEVVFDVIAEPYLLRTPHAMADKLDVVESGNDMVLAAHHPGAPRPGGNHAGDGSLRTAHPGRLSAGTWPGSARR